MGRESQSEKIFKYSLIFILCMLNYGEELVYWYLRLNGFFIISNFVLHRESESRGDADHLAVRLPRVTEYVRKLEDGEEKYEEVSFDEELFKYIDKDKIVGIIAEVKAGLADSSYSPNIFFNEQRLRKALERLGMYCGNLEKEKWYKKDVGDGYQVVKILFSNHNKDFEIKNDKYLIVSLRHVEKFIIDRLKEYKEEKAGSWVYFPSNLLQYIIWYMKSHE